MTPIGVGIAVWYKGDQMLLASHEDMLAHSWRARDWCDRVYKAWLLFVADALIFDDV